jgi:hypothetical protein
MVAATLVQSAKSKTLFRNENSHSLNTQPFGKFLILRAELGDAGFLPNLGEKFRESI